MDILELPFQRSHCSSFDRHRHTRFQDGCVFPSFPSNRLPQIRKLRETPREKDKEWRITTRHRRKKNKNAAIVEITGKKKSPDSRILLTPQYSSGFDVVL
mmetsp:Transcript_6825/g.10757  ORF Transcript_6825/g.10757 Transcript_6825/m.10757 type:complete len:100 (+) Transcript_6825:58-357(+)